MSKCKISLQGDLGKRNKAQSKYTLKKGRKGPIIQDPFPAMAFDSYHVSYLIAMIAIMLAIDSYDSYHVSYLIAIMLAI